jgi:hypothetical protein
MNKEITYEDYKTALKIVKGFEFQISNLHSASRDKIRCLARFGGKDKNITPETSIYRAGFSLRIRNALYSYFNKDMTVKELSKISFRELGYIRHIGENSLQEMKNLFNNLGLNYIN